MRMVMRVGPPKSQLSQCACRPSGDFHLEPELVARHPLPGKNGCIFPVLVPCDYLCQVLVRTRVRSGNSDLDIHGLPLN